MSSKSAISWTDRTWNPVVGCTKVSPGCDHCYAATLHNQRYGHNVKAAIAAIGGPGSVKADMAGVGGHHAMTLPQAARDDCLVEDDTVELPFPEQYDVPFRVVQLKPERLSDPLRWRTPSRVFVNSVSDLFHKDVPDEFLDRCFAVMALAQQHIFQVLTKRPERMREYMARFDAPAAIAEYYVEEPKRAGRVPLTKELALGLRRPLANVWLGTSCEDQERANERIPHLLATPATVRFLSCEPLLGPIDLGRHMRVPIELDGVGGLYTGVTPLTGFVTDMGRPCPLIRPLDWVIVGGESGRRFRPMDPAWARSLRDDCGAAGVAYFGKQDSGPKPERPLPGELGDREFPKRAAS